MRFAGVVEGQDHELVRDWFEGKTGQHGRPSHGTAPTVCVGVITDASCVWTDGSRWMARGWDSNSGRGAGSSAIGRAERLRGHSPGAACTYPVRQSYFFRLKKA